MEPKNKSTLLPTGEKGEIVLYNLMKASAWRCE